jgi:hypothetical protein
MMLAAFSKSRDNAAWINNIFALFEAEQAKHANDLLVKGRFEDHAVGVPRITQLRERPWFAAETHRRTNSIAVFRWRGPSCQLVLRLSAAAFIGRMTASAASIT